MCRSSLYNPFDTDTDSTKGWVKAESISIPGVSGLHIEDKALAAFRGGGDAERLEGTWIADWYALDEAGNPKPYEVRSPGDPSKLVPYSSEEIKGLSQTGPWALCTGRKPKPVVLEETIYWLAGRVSHDSEIGLPYWNAENDMNGSVYLKCTHPFPHSPVLEGFWLGRTWNNDLVRGAVKWRKGHQ